MPEIPELIKLPDLIGQAQVKQRIATAVDAAKLRGQTPEHMLFYGGSGLGKTQLAYATIDRMAPAGDVKLLTATDLNGKVNVIVEAANGKEKNVPTGAVPYYLTRLKPGSVVFVDEIHALGGRAQTDLLVAMERFIADGKAVAPFTLIGATTDPGRLPPALRSRFKLAYTLQPYTREEVAEILNLHAGRQKMTITKTARRLLAKVCQRNMRVAVGIMGECRDVCQLHPDPNLGDGIISQEVVKRVLEGRGICEEGLLNEHRWIMQSIGCSEQVSRDALRRSVGLDMEMVEEALDVLRSRGFAVQQSRGHALTARGRTYLSGKGLLEAAA